MVLLESHGPKPKELSIEAIDVSVSDMTDGASLDRLPHLLGVLPDDDEEDEYTIKEEMRFALRESHETVLRQTASLDAEDRSTISSLTYELYPSYDELHKSYVVRNDLEPKAFTEQKNSIDAENASDTQSSTDNVSPWKRRFHLSPKHSRRIQSCIRVLNVSKKTLVVAAVVMLLALIAITASSSVISSSRGSRGVDSIEAAEPGDEGGAPDIQTGGYQSKPNEPGPITRPASKSSKENASLATAQSSDLGEAIVITSKSDGGVLSHFNSSSHEGGFEDDPHPGANSTDSPSFSSIQTPTLTPTNHPTNSIETEAHVLFHTSSFDTPTYYPSYAEILIETQAPSRAKTYTDEPTLISTSEPTQYPSLRPSGKPLPLPTPLPTYHPSKEPTTLSPSFAPSFMPSKAPLSSPSHAPTHHPSNVPTLEPTSKPSKQPSGTPSSSPMTPLPSPHPSESPTTSAPTITPSFSLPTPDPSTTTYAPSSGNTTYAPTPNPVPSPTPDPLIYASIPPSDEPTNSPSHPLPVPVTTYEPTIASTAESTLSTTKPSVAYITLEPVQVEPYSTSSPVTSEPTASNTECQERNFSYDAANDKCTNDGSGGTYDLSKCCGIFFHWLGFECKYIDICEIFANETSTSEYQSPVHTQISAEPEDEN